MRLALVIAFFCTAFVVLAQQVQAPKGTEAPAGFDGGHNGLVGEEDFLADKEEFEGVEGIKDGLGRTQFKLRTPPLWGVRMRTRLMHDGASVTFNDAIRRHRGEAIEVFQRYDRLSDADQEAMFAFLGSL